MAVNISAISLEKFVEQLNTELNTASTSAGAGVVFDIVADGEEYKKPTRSGNDVTIYTQGSAVVLESNIVPAQGITVLTETIGIVIGVPIKDGERLVGDDENGYTPERIPYNESILPVKNILTEYFSQIHTGTITTSGTSAKTYSTSFVGSQPQASEIDIRANIGLSIEYSLYITYVVILNGLNSQDIKVYFGSGTPTVYEQIPCTTCTITRVPTQDGGAFANSNGVSKIYNANTALEIDLSVPALTNSVLTKKYFDFLFKGADETFSVKVEYPKLQGESGNGNNTVTYTMRFAQGNIAMDGVKNVGQSITFVEAL